MPGYSRKIALPGKSAQEIFEKISKGIDWVENNDSGKFGKMEFARDPGTLSVSLTNTMVSASLTCSDGEIVLDAKLSMIAYAFRSKIDEGIDRWIKKTFPA